jgi:uncharacterized membrane protein
MRRLAWTLVGVHVAAMVFGLFGILVAIPHPELWARDPHAAAVYAFAIGRAGGSGMILGALAMLAYGAWAYGWRRTLLFFVLATAISAGAELTGTKTGWPFGGYAYLQFLGPKLLDRVPFTIPLAWFYMGFASFALADAIARAHPRRALASIVLGTYLLVAWDLVLDPSMAAPQLRYLHFWAWSEGGAYFGMPLRNLAGWFGTGLVFIGFARWSWHERNAPDAPPAMPYVVYTTNVVWSIVLALAAGMWPVALIGVLLSLAPATLAVWPHTRRAAFAAAR